MICKLYVNKAVTFFLQDPVKIISLLPIKVVLFFPFPFFFLNLFSLHKLFWSAAPIQSLSLFSKANFTNKEYMYSFKYYNECWKV